MNTSDPRTNVLTKINKIRRSVGVLSLTQLPRGVMSDPDECPLQVALRVLDPTLRVGKYHISVGRRHAATIAAHLGHGRHAFVSLPTNRDRVGISLNKKTREFISRFDHGQYPELIKDNELHRSIAMAKEDELGGSASDGGAEGMVNVPDTVPAEWGKELQHV